MVACSCGGDLFGSLSVGRLARAQTAPAQEATEVCESAFDAAEAKGKRLQELVRELECGTAALQVLESGKHPLAKLLVHDCGVSVRVLGYLVSELGVESIQGFVELLSDLGLEAGLREILVGTASFAEQLQPASKLQAARLRLAWHRAQAAASDGLPDPNASGVKKEVVGLGWITPEIHGVSAKALWAALEYQALHPEDFLNIMDVTVAKRDGFLARAMTLNSTGKRVHEHIYIREMEGEVVYRLLDGRTMAETEDEHVIAVNEEPLRLELFHRHAFDGHRSYWQAPLGPVRRMLRRLAAHAGKAAEQSP